MGRTPSSDVLHCDFGRAGVLHRPPDPTERNQRALILLSAFKMEEDHEDDCRKEAALERNESPRGGRNPVAAAVAVVNRILPLSSSPADLLPPTAASVQMELPFLVTHYLASYRPRDGTYGAGSSPADPHHDQQAAVERIRRAATELAGAFEALGAFGTAMRVRGLDRRIYCVPEEVSL